MVVTNRKYAVSMEDDWELLDMHGEAIALQCLEVQVQQKVEAVEQDIQPPTLAEANAPSEPSPLSEAKTANNSSAATPKQPKSRSGLEPFAVLLVVWGVLSILWQSFLLSRVEATMTSTGRRPPVTVREADVSAAVDDVAIEETLTFPTVTLGLDPRESQIVETANATGSFPAETWIKSTSLQAAATLSTSNITSCSSSQTLRNNNKKQIPYKVYVHSSPAARLAVGEKDILKLANMHPYAWEEPQLWAEVFAYTNDRSVHANQATQWSTLVARITEETFPSVVSNPTECTLVLTFARWCGQVAEFLKNVDLSAVAEELRYQGHWNVTVGAFESSKVHLPDRIAKLIPGGVHWLNLVLYPEAQSQTFGLRFGDWFGVRSLGATTADVVNFVNAYCGKDEAMGKYTFTSTSHALIPKSSASPATALEWSAASLLGSDVSEEPQLPVSGPCTLCVLGHSSACTRCSSRVLARYGTMLEEHISLAKYIKSHLASSYVLT